MKGTGVQITFDIDITQADRDALIAAIGCDAAALDAALNGHAKAALTEYLETYLGRRVFSRGSDFLEHRLALLIEHALDRKIPNDAGISRLFQTTLSASRTLIRNALSKYRYQLQAAMNGSAATLLEAVSWRADGGFYQAEVKAMNLVELLNQRLTADDPTLKPLSRLPDSVATFAIAPDSYDLLCGAFGAAAVAR
ncbi:MAG: hypothetical protein JWR80_519 [Bradyrhizobium sp.]|nr:hypothetical protein [Bradyrhizobium sp.]